MGGLLSRLVGGGPLGNMLEDGWNGAKNIPVIGGFFDAICHIIEPEMHQPQVEEEPPVTITATETQQYTPPVYTPPVYAPPAYTPPAYGSYSQPSYGATYAAAANLVAQYQSTLPSTTAFAPAPATGSWGQASAVAYGN